MARSLDFLPLSRELLSVAEPWFDDPATSRFLGSRDWIRREVELLTSQPGTEFRGTTVTGRHAWLVREAEGPFLGFVGTESYDDGSAALSIVVAPEARGRGLARLILQALDDRSELAGVERYVGGIEPENRPALRAVQAAGFQVAKEPDDEGMLEVARWRNASVQQT